VAAIGKITEYLIHFALDRANSLINHTNQAIKLRAQQETATKNDFDTFARYYDADYRHYDDDLQLIVDLAQLEGEQVLELGSGTGRALLPVAAAGRKVTGVDGSPALLSIAAEKVKHAHLAGQIRLVHDDLRTFQLEQHFDFAYCVSNTLMHLTTQEDQLAVLTNAARHLRPGGLLLIDLFSPDLLRLSEISGVQELADHWVDEETGAAVLKWSVRQVNVSQQLQETLFIYEEIHTDGHVEKRAIPFTLRFLWPSEGQLLLRMAGFTVEETFGDFDGNPYDDSSERLIYLARKIANTGSTFSPA
jgi:SAM-dependent methyltransferase